MHVFDDIGAVGKVDALVAEGKAQRFAQETVCLRFFAEAHDRRTVDVQADDWQETDDLLDFAPVAIGEYAFSPLLGKKEVIAVYANSFLVKTKISGIDCVELLSWAQYVNFKDLEEMRDLSDA